jgi:hypothetical protein
MRVFYALLLAAAVCTVDAFSIANPMVRHINPIEDGVLVIMADQAGRCCVICSLVFGHGSHDSEWYISLVSCGQRVYYSIRTALGL